MRSIELIIAGSKELVEKNMIRSSEGNISVRLNSDQFLISASGLELAYATEKDFVEVDFQGGYSSDIIPSSEWRFHRDIYINRSEVNVIIHTHSEYAATLSVLREDLPAFHYMIAIAGGNSVRCAPYQVFGSAELSDVVVCALRDRKACLMSNHGLIATGSTLKEAMSVAIEIESLCKQYVTARSIGKVVILTDAEMYAVHEKFDDYERNKDRYRVREKL